MTLQKDELTTDINKLLILGSGSSARKELLNSVGLTPNKIVIPDVDEGLKLNESPRNYVKRIATRKANAINSERGSFLVTADTIVTVGRRFLMKTYDDTEAEMHLRLLSGRRHNVFTAFCVKYNGLVRLSLVKTVLKMKVLTDEEIVTYLDSREWVGCAGAYSIQGKAKCFFPFISGCYSNVVGLPLPKLTTVLNNMGYFEKRY
jgi:septum formation protein